MDKVLLLYFLRQADPIWGRTKIQKSALFTELALDKEALAGPSFAFYRWKNGAFSQELWADLSRLVSAGFIEKTSDSYTVSERGEFLLELAIPELRNRPQNSEAFEIMDEALKWCQPRTGKQLIDAAYELKVEPEGMPGRLLKIKDIPFGIDILVPRPNVLDVSLDLVTVIREELAMSTKTLEEARQRASATEKKAIARLQEAISEREPA